MTFNKLTSTTPSTYSVSSIMDSVTNWYNSWQHPQPSIPTNPNYNSKPVNDGAAMSVRRVQPKLDVEMGGAIPYVDYTIVEVTYHKPISKSRGIRKTQHC